MHAFKFISTSLSSITGFLPIRFVKNQITVINQPTAKKTEVHNQTLLPGSLFIAGALSTCCGNSDILAEGIGVITSD